jgi:hypothetical protein
MFFVAENIKENDAILQVLRKFGIHLQAFNIHTFRWGFLLREVKLLIYDDDDLRWIQKCKSKWCN